MLRTAGNRDTPTQEILKKAPLVSSPEEDQFYAAVVDHPRSDLVTPEHCVCVVHLGDEQGRQAYTAALWSVRWSRPWWCR